MEIIIDLSQGAIPWLIGIGLIGTFIGLLFATIFTIVEIIVELHNNRKNKKHKEDE